MQSVAVVYFPQMDVSQINELRKKYDKGWQIILPHITIIAPVSDIPEEALIQHVESVIKEIEPFSIRLSGLTTTQDHCLFLQVQDGDEQIKALHAKLYTGILANREPTEYPFEPHITLGCCEESEEVLQTALQEAEKMQIDVTCDFDSLAIIKGDGSSPAVIVVTEMLGS